MTLPRLDDPYMALVMAFIEGLMADIDEINNKLKQLFKFRFISDQDIKNLILTLEKTKDDGQSFLAQVADTSHQKKGYKKK
jgi:hypothetical protein